jgi:hypothetical protein
MTVEIGPVPTIIDAAPGKVRMENGQEKDCVVVLVVTPCGQQRFFVPPDQAHYVEDQIRKARETAESTAKTRLVIASGMPDALKTKV